MKSGSFAVRFRLWLFVALIVLYLAIQVGQVKSLATLLSAMSALAILVSLPAAGWIARVLALGFVGTGTWMLWSTGAGLATALGAYGEMVYLLALFAVLPILAVPVRLGGYSAAIETVLRGRVAGVQPLFCLITSLSFLCGSFLSLAAVPIMMASMEPVISRYPIPDKVRFMAVSSTFGYVLPILWTPVSGVVGVVLYSLRLDWISLFPILFAISLAGLFAGWGMFWLLEVRPARARLQAGASTDGADDSVLHGPANAATTAPPAPPAPPDGASGAVSGSDAFAARRLWQMILAILLLIGTIAVLEQVMRIGLVTIVTLVAVPFSLIWSLVIGHGRQAVGEVGRQLALRLPHMADQFALFLSAGFFAAAMRLSGFDAEVNLMFLHVRDAVGTEPFLLLMPPMALAASFLGVHPLVAIALLSESLRPEVLGIPATKIAVTLIGSALMTYMMGPFSGTLGLVQSLNKVSTYRLSLWNAPYAFAYLIVFCIAVLLL